jgi:hypothetical protein
VLLGFSLAVKFNIFVNRVLRRISGPKWDEGGGGWRRLHNKDLHNLYDSLNIIRAIKSRRMRLVWHAASMGGMRNEYKIFVR